MFSLFGNKTKIKVQQMEDAAARIQQVIENETKSTAQIHESRHSKRYYRSIPVMLSGWTEEGPSDRNIVFGVTKDVSDFGFGIFTQQPIEADEIVIGLLPDSTVELHVPFFHAEVIHRQNRFSLHETGLAATEYLNNDFPRQVSKLLKSAVAARRELEPLAAQAVPV